MQTHIHYKVNDDIIHLDMGQVLQGILCPVLQNVLYNGHQLVNEWCVSLLDHESTLAEDWWRLHNHTLKQVGIDQRTQLKTDQILDSLSNVNSDYFIVAGEEENEFSDKHLGLGSTSSVRILQHSIST